MGGSRAVFASLGTSVVLVAAAAISLLVVSAVVAFGGWQDDVAQSANRPALVFDDASPSEDGEPARVARDVTEPETVVIAAVAPQPEKRAEDTARTAPGAVGVPEDDPATPPADVVDVPGLDPPLDTRTPAPPAPPPVALPAVPSAGDGVRDLGEDLSSTVENTGQALADATAPLAPPVSAAVQEVLNIVAALLRRGTGALGDTLDSALPR